MTNEPINSILQWFRAAVPQPTLKSKSVQIGVHFEEVAEMADAIGNSDLAVRIDYVANQYKRNVAPLDKIDRRELIDALADQIVTAVGIGYMFGMDIEGAVKEVMRANWSKFVDGKPEFDENGKIKKAAGYVRPDLTPFVGSDTAN